MIQTTWVELANIPRMTWADGRPLEPFTPFELTQRLRIRPEGSTAEAHWPFPYSLQLAPGPGGVMVNGLELGVGALVPVGGVHPGNPMVVRVLASPKESAGWPSGLARPPAPWSDETLSVLADQLLELGHIVGQRFLQRDEKADASWLPALAGVWPQRTVIGWRRGVVESLSIATAAGFEVGKTLALQAVCAPMQRLVIRCAPEGDPIGMISGLIAGGGLPCLETFRCEVDPQRKPEELRTLPGLSTAFPVLKVLEVVPDPMPVLRMPVG